ncbi:hypothetical protein [uncultured Chitinophaga sp.]|jgi:hypothetical protein|uniref:hypothetical protein n=1 Tax=uncultured Chitinophaga sp. TaxID=339340 RepID=UPI00260D9754|nr:hypothetical protein [uncultured Chitinophaga sp.]
MRKRTIVKSIFLIVLLGYVLCPFRSFAQNNIDVRAQADTDRLRIGEQLKLELSATVDVNRLKEAGLQLAFPSLPDSFAHWEVVDRSKVDTSGSAREQLFRQVITLTSFDSGHWEIPSLKFELQAAAGAVDSAFTAPIGIDVDNVAVDTTKAFKPIKGVRTVAISLWESILDFLREYWPFIVTGLVLIGLIIGWFIYMRKRPAKAPAPPPVPLEAPFDKAVRQLKELAAEKVWQQGNVKEYYTRLTDVLRSYFEEQFGIAALEQTSAELLQNIKPVTILNQQREKLRNLLSLADLAKFAKLQPTPEEHEDSLQKALEIVEWTKPAAKPAETEQPAADSKS